jgi:hypothetical protein
MIINLKLAVENFTCADYKNFIQKKVSTSKQCKYFVFFILFMLLPIASLADTHRAASASYADVSAAVAAASSADTVEVPPGSVTWSNTLTIKRGIILQGAGINQTTIAGPRTLVVIEPDATAKANHETFVVKGFTFDGNNATSENLGYSGLIFPSNNSVSYVNIAIINNKFMRTTGTGVWARGTFHGVVASNQFDMVSMPIRAFGASDSDTDGGPSWSAFAQQYGVAQNLYFEDNVMSWSSTALDRTCGWTETGMGGRIVIRYNTWNETNCNPEEYWDVHGLQNGGSSYSSMVGEYYGNKIINDPGTSYRWMYARGGWTMMFNNTSNRAFGGGGNGITEYYCDSTALHGNYRQKAVNSYFWNNFGNGVDSKASYSDPGSGFPNCPGDLPTENIDFFNYNGSCTSNSCFSGVGCGPATPTGTCTVGVVYWKTSQSCSNISDMVGASPSTKISGTLYKCTAPNTWTPYFTPFTYPHPLRAESAAIAAPQGVRIIN